MVDTLSPSTGTTPTGIDALGAPNTTGVAGAAPAIPAPAQPPTGTQGNANDFAAMQPPPDVPGNHAKLFGMLQGLGVTLSAAGKSISTHGKEGGAPEVVQYEQQKAAEQRAQQDQIMRQKDFELRTKAMQAQTNAQIVSTNIALDKAPVELQKAHLEVMEGFMNMAKELGIPPVVAIQMVPGQDTATHMQAVKSAIPGGDLVGNTAIPSQTTDARDGKGGSTSIFNFDAMAKVQVPADQAAPLINKIRNEVDIAKTLGVDQSVIDNATAHLDALGKSQSIDGKTLWQLTNQIENPIIAASATKQAEMKARKESADLKVAETTAQNAPAKQAGDIALAGARTASANAAAGKTQLETEQTKKEAADIAKPDVTGFSSKLTPKEYDARYPKFTASKEYQTLGTLKASVQQFDDIVANMKKGDFSGAASVVALFDAVGISATPLAGKGMRINNDVIHEHIDARGIPQATYAKMLNLQKGDIITPDQLNDYAGIAQGATFHAYVNAADEAHRQGLPVDFLPQGGGIAPDPTTASIYATTVLHANPTLASEPAKLRAAVTQAMTTNGWKVQ